MFANISLEVVSSSIMSPGVPRFCLGFWFQPHPLIFLALFWLFLDSPLWLETPDYSTWSLKKLKKHRATYESSIGGEFYVGVGTKSFVQNSNDLITELEEIDQGMSLPTPSPSPVGHRALPRVTGKQSSLSCVDTPFTLGRPVSAISSPSSSHFE